MSTGKRPIVHVLLTFDVEEAEYGGQLDLKTQRVVGALKEFGPPPATFFLDGAATLTYPNSVRLLAENGFELALHSDYHPDVGARHHRKMDFGSQDSKTQISRIQNAISMIRSVIPDFDPRGFRSPNWSWNEDLYFSLNKLGFLYDSSQRARKRRDVFQPHLRGEVVVFPMNCGEQDDVLYKFGPQYVINAWCQWFNWACQATYETGESYFVLMSHPCVIGKAGYTATLKTMLKYLNSMSQYVDVKYQTGSEAATEYKQKIKKVET